MNLVVSTEGGSGWNWQNAGSPGAWAQDTANPDLWRIGGNVSNSSFGLSFGLELDPDPFVNNTFTLTNNTAVTQTYTISVVLPVTPALPPFTQTFGTISGTLLDANNNGFAQMSTSGGAPLYMSLIDGGNYMPLYTAPFTLNTAPIGSASATLNTQFFFFPGGQPGVTTSIAITNTFTLSAGDAMTMTSAFRIDPEVPAPGAAGALALAGIAAARRRRR